MIPFSILDEFFLADEFFDMTHLNGTISCAENKFLYLFVSKIHNFYKFGLTLFVCFNTTKITHFSDTSKFFFFEENKKDED